MKEHVVCIWCGYNVVVSNSNFLTIGWRNHLLYKYIRINKEYKTTILTEYEAANSNKKPTCIVNTVFNNYNNMALFITGTLIIKYPKIGIQPSIKPFVDH